MKRKKNQRLNKPFLIFAAMLLFISCENQRARREFDQGQKLYQQGSFLEAIRNWEIILGSFPKSAYADDALHWIGVTYYVDLDLPDRAIAAFSRLIKEHPDSSYGPQDQILVADIFRNRREYSRALTEYARFLNLFPDNEKIPLVWYQLITCLFEVGEYQAVRVQSEQLLKKFPQSEWADDCVYWIGESYFLQGDQKLAREYFQKYLKQYPKGELAFKSEMGIARSLEEEGYLPEAIAKYQELQTRYPSEKSAQTRLDSAQKRLQNKQTGVVIAPDEEPEPLPTPIP